MTRGKHAHSAAVRKVAADRDAEIARYQKRVAEQHAEIKRLREKMRHDEQVHREALRRVIAERDQGLSPTVDILERQAQTLRDERDAAIAHERDIRREWEALGGRANDLLIRLGMLEASRMEALAFIFRGITGIRVRSDSVPANVANSMPPERLEQLQRIRNERN